MTETYQGSAPQACHFQPVSWYRSNYILFRIGEILMGWYVHSALSSLASLISFAAQAILRLLL